jgi:hypothetical protein
VRTLFVGALAATLVGCSCFVSPQAGIEACTGADGNGLACVDRTALGQTIESVPSSINPNQSASKARSATAAKMKKPSSAHRSDGSKVAMKTGKPATTTMKVETVATKPQSVATKAEPAATKLEPSATKVEPPAPVRSAETSDEVIAKAKITVAAKLEDPASAKFGEMRRARRTNLLGQSVDTICGLVKGKNASGEESGDKPFLYLVKDDEAYVVDGPPASAAATAYRNICN